MTYDTLRSEKQKNPPADNKKPLIGKRTVPEKSSKASPEIEKVIYEKVKKNFM